MKNLIGKTATSEWRTIETIPKDGRSILVRFAGGSCYVCYWDSWPVGGENPQVYGGQTVVQGSPPDEYDSGWVIDGTISVIYEEPIAWAEINTGGVK